jgi:hypothetical protein
LTQDHSLRIHQESTDIFNVDPYQTLLELDYNLLWKAAIYE